MSLPIGTKVRLASGGPDMLVVDFDKDGFKVLAAWRALDGTTHEAWYSTVCVDVIRRFHIVDWRRIK